jgi:hypothetical protein
MQGDAGTESMCGVPALLAVWGFRLGFCTAL